jgi:hypothetical protein
MFSPEAKAINLVAGAGADAMESNHRHRDFQTDWPTLTNR